jgi:hypothetical protein
MVSKIKTSNGTIAIQIQQTSNLAKWLQKWHNYLKTAPTSEWAQTSVTIRCPNMGEVITASRVSPQKAADTPYQAQGQNVTWNLMSAEMQKDVI